jgi:DNA-binding MarR family transcriptional regulator
MAIVIFFARGRDRASTPCKLGRPCKNADDENNLDLSICLYMPILFIRKAFSMNLNHGDKSVCHAMALRKASRRLSQMYDAALAPVGLTITQYGLLTEVLKRGEKAPTVTELAAAMVMERSGLGHTLGPLERDGYIVLVVNAEDARSRHVVLTVRGKTLQAKASKLWLQAQNKFAEVVGSNEAKKLQETFLSIAHDDRLSV